MMQNLFNATYLLFIGIEITVFACSYVLFGTKQKRAVRTVAKKRPVWFGKLFSFISENSYWQKAVSSKKKEQLKNACIKEMPQVLDVVTLGLSAGLSFDASLDLYCENYSDEMSYVFKRALMTWRLGSKTRSSTLNDLAQEIDIQAFSSFVSAVTQALEFGAPLAGALKGQATTIRDVQSSEVEEQIEKVPVKMLVPLGTLIVPAMLLSILGPLLAGSTVIF